MYLLTPEIIADVENEKQGLGHGIIGLELHVRGDKLHFYRLKREKSVVTDQISERGKTNKNRWRNNDRRGNEL